MSQLASDHAHRVVGLYGDPTVSWSILLEARLATPLDPAKARDRLKAAIEEHPHLGAVPDVLTVPAAEFSPARERFAATPYERGEPLIRVAVATDTPAVLIAAHHGALDGLGLLSVLATALDVPISSGAKGIGARTADHSFLASAFRRLFEALFAPPARISPDRVVPEPGDVFDARNEPKARISSASFVAAAARATERWNTQHGVRTARVVAAVGASNRGGESLEPKHDSAFFRLRLRPGPAVEDVGKLLAEQPPEPDFPARESRFMRLGTRILASRLGSTFLVSNLGVVTAGDAVRSLAFYPAASGRSGVAFGAATVGETTTVTIRARRKDFDGPSAGQLVDELVTAVRRQGGSEDARPGRGHAGDVAHQ